MIYRILYAVMNVLLFLLRMIVGGVVLGVAAMIAFTIYQSGEWKVFPVVFLVLVLIVCCFWAVSTFYQWVGRKAEESKRRRP